LGYNGFIENGTCVGDDEDLKGCPSSLSSAERSFFFSYSSSARALLLKKLHGFYLS
jgi:hypothetical protein